MDKIYAVVSLKSGRYIGMGLYDDHKVFHSFHKTHEGADMKKDKMEKEDGIDCYVSEITLKD